MSHQASFSRRATRDARYLAWIVPMSSCSARGACPVAVHATSLAVRPDDQTPLANLIAGFSSIRCNAAFDASASWAQAHHEHPPRSSARELSHRACRKSRIFFTFLRHATKDPSVKVITFCGHASIIGSSPSASGEY